MRLTQFATPVTLALLLALGLSLMYGCKRQDTVVRTASSASGDSASIVAYRDSILGTYSADLVIHSRDGRIILRTNLIQSRDSIEDIPIEFFSLKFNANVVQIGTRAVHYRGPTEFTFHAAVPRTRE
jgi:hypothetical protein